MKPYYKESFERTVRILELEGWTRSGDRRQWSLGLLPGTKYVVMKKEGMVIRVQPRTPSGTWYSGTLVYREG